MSSTLTWKINRHIFIGLFHSFEKRYRKLTFLIKISLYKKVIVKLASYTRVRVFYCEKQTTTIQLPNLTNDHRLQRYKPVDQKKKNSAMKIKIPLHPVYCTILFFKSQILSLSIVKIMSQIRSLSFFPQVFQKSRSFQIVQYTGYIRLDFVSKLNWISDILAN